MSTITNIKRPAAKLYILRVHGVVLSAVYSLSLTTFRRRSTDGLFFSGSNEQHPVHHPVPLWRFSDSDSVYNVTTNYLLRMHRLRWVGEPRDKPCRSV